MVNATISSAPDESRLFEAIRALSFASVKDFKVEARDWTPAVRSSEFKDDSLKADSWILRRDLYDQFRTSAESRSFPNIRQSIEGSRWILELEEDWDGEGAEAYAPSTWQRAVDFLWQLSRRSEEVFGFEIDAPAMSPADGASIDLFWPGEFSRLLINVPSDPSAPITYYGQDEDGRVISGETANDSPRPEIVAWLYSHIG